MDVRGQRGQGNEISCSWLVKEPGGAYAPKMSHETWVNYDGKTAMKDHLRYADNPSKYAPGLKQKAQDIRNQTVVDKWGPTHRILEEEFSEDRASFLFERRTSVSASHDKDVVNHRYYGFRHILYRGIYTIHLAAEEFKTGEELKDSMDAVESCLKAMLDGKEAGRAAAGDYVVGGVVTDGFGNKVKHAMVSLRIDGKEAYSTTGGGGYYEFPYNGSVEKNAECRLSVSLKYLKDGKNYFNILYGGNPVRVYKDFRINKAGDLNQDLDMKDGLKAPVYGGSPDPSVIRHFGIMYTHMAEALEYYMDYHHANVDYKLPVDVETFVKDSDTYYSSDDSTIVINFRDSLHMSPDRPMNREWHEFSHHVMYSMYGRWPKPPEGATPPEANHGGYINPSTSDSFVEGFAEYGAMTICDHYKYPDCDVYASIGNLEVDYKAWDYRGAAEELAVAGALWDLYDERNDDGIDLTSDQIWGALKEYNKDFTFVHDRLVSKYPNHGGDIDSVFKAHGLWADKNRGNGRLDEDEPRRGEYFIDYPLNWTYDAGENIGPATNYQRPQRTSAVKLPGHYVKVKNDTPYYGVKVEFPKKPDLDYQVRTENIGGLVYVHVPPPGYGAKITVTAEGVATGNPLTFTSQQFNDKLTESIGRGYFVEHDFQTVGQPPAQTPTPPAVTNTDAGKPHWELRDNEAKSEDYKHQPPARMKKTGQQTEPTMQTCCCTPLLTGALALFGAVVGTKIP